MSDAQKARATIKVEKDDLLEIHGGLLEGQRKCKDEWARTQIQSACQCRPGTDSNSHDAFPVNPSRKPSGKGREDNVS